MHDQWNNQSQSIYKHDKMVMGLPHVVTVRTFGVSYDSETVMATFSLIMRIVSFMSLSAVQCVWNKFCSHFLSIIHS